MRKGAAAKNATAKGKNGCKAIVTLTYSPEHDSVSMRVAEANVQAFIRSLNHQQKKNKGQPRVCYINATRQDSRGGYYHSIGFMRELDAAEVAELWNLGKSQIKKLEEDKDTATDIDRYIHRKAIRWEG